MVPELFEMLPSLTRPEIGLFNSLTAISDNAIPHDRSIMIGVEHSLANSTRISTTFGYSDSVCRVGHLGRLVRSLEASFLLVFIQPWCLSVSLRTTLTFNTR